MWAIDHMIGSCILKKSQLVNLFQFELYLMLMLNSDFIRFHTFAYDNLFEFSRQLADLVLALCFCRYLLLFNKKIYSSKNQSS